MEKEIGLLRSALIGFLGKDKEGEYRPEFVKRALKTSALKPKYEFKDSRSFLAHLRAKIK